MNPKPANLPVAILSSFDRFGGAAIAAHRLHSGLRELGIESSMFVWRRDSEANGVTQVGARTGYLLAKLATWLHRRLLMTRFGPGSAGFRAGWPIQAVSAPLPSRGIVHAHWVSDGFVQLRSLERCAGRLVLTLHDMWWFTGGCHYDGGCGRYTAECGRCPLLKSTDPQDLTHRIHERRRSFFERARPLVISPSRWLADHFRASPFATHCRVEIVPNSLDTEKFRPMDRRQQRALRGLPSDAPMVMFGAFNVRNPIKGWDLLVPALRELRRMIPDLQALVVGHYDPSMDVGDLCPINFTGPISDEGYMAETLACANVLVVPSREENFPNTILESLACGVPAVGFRVGGIPESIEEGATGYLAAPFNTTELADSMRKAIDLAGSMRGSCRAVALAKYSSSPLARHIELYKEILSS